MAIIVPQTLVNLLSYFRTGDKPTQDEFEELIRTFFHNYQEAMDAAAAAVAAAEAASTLIGTRAPKVMGHITDGVLDWGVGIDRVEANKVYFETAFADNLYIAQIAWDTIPPARQQAGGSLDFVLPSAYPVARTAAYLQYDATWTFSGFGVLCWDGR